MTEFSDFLSSLGIENTKNFDLSKASSFRIGGTASIAVFPKNETELIESVKASKQFNKRFEVIGNGSNVLFADEGFSGAIIFTQKMNSVICEGEIISAMCGARLSAISVFARDNSLSGLEFAQGIPGTLGGAMVMNAGAYGGSMSDIVTSSRAFDVDSNQVIELDISDHEFGYRQSIYEKNKSLICISATLNLMLGDTLKIKSTMKRFSESRREKQPLDFPSCGSYFKRPEGNFAGKLIEDAGLKGFSVGGAMVSNKHAGFVINAGNATSKDVIALENIVRNTVFEKFGIMLEREVRYIK